MTVVTTHTQNPFVKFWISKFLNKILKLQSEIEFSSKKKTNKFL